MRSARIILNCSLVFGATRSSGGFNNDPTAQQFISTYMRLLMRSSIQGGKVNCQIRDATKIFSVVTDTCKVNGKNITINVAPLIRKYDLVNRPFPMQSDHDYCDSPNMVSFSEFKKEAVIFSAFVIASHGCHG